MTTPIQLTQTTSVDLAPIVGLIISFVLIFFIASLAFYIYFAVALMFIAKKTNTPKPWLAFIPITNLYLMSKIAKTPWWTILLVIFLPVVNFIIVIWWWWKIAKNINRPGWWSLLLLIPIVNIIILGIMAWAGKKTKTRKNINVDPWK